MTDSAAMGHAADYFGEGYYQLYRNRLLPEAQTESEARWLLKQLRPSRGEHWLDAPCGYGRHLRALNGLRPDLRLAGIDLNGDYLREPGLSASATGVRADLRRLPLANGRFDVVLNMLNSFGYFGGPLEGDRAVLREFGRVLRPGGRLVLDLPNRRALLLEIRQHPRIRYSIEDHEAEESFEWDADSQCVLNRTTWRWPGGSEERGYRLRLYTPAQIQSELQRAGLEPEGEWGDFTGSRFDPFESERFLVIARKIHGCPY